MKKLFSIMLLIVLICTTVCVMASAEDYAIVIEREGEVFKDVPINVDVKLIGTNAPAKQKVRVKVDVSGPSVPKLIAKDSLQTEIDIAQIGYWGPEEGFAVGGTFTNTTPVTATFSEAGLYEIKLSLIDLTDSSVITTSETSIYVYRDQAELDEILGQQNTVNTSNTANTSNNQTNAVNNELSEIPQTGPTFGEYAFYGVILVVLLGAGYFMIRNYKIRQG